tara:strand:+ start:4125 stop:4256 length:132 start_codon:yes stop_codon:yes gene_type:complete
MNVNEKRFNITCLDIIKIKEAINAVLIENRITAVVQSKSMSKD